MNVLPSISWIRNPFSSSRRRTVRMVESFMGRVEASASRHASAVVEPWLQMKSMTLCSTSPRFFRRGCLVLVIVALQYVTLEHRYVKRKLRHKFLRTQEGRISRGTACGFVSLLGGLACRQ